MQLAESVIAACLMALSVFFMVYAAELPIGWDAATGPGGGAFPFWLGLVMLACSAAILIRELTYNHHIWRLYSGVDEGGGPKPASHIPDTEADEPFMTWAAFKDVALVAGLLIGCIALIHWVGAYVAIPLFMLIYLRFIGKHGWLLTGLMSTLTPVFMFFFFEVTLKILLPKGVTEPLFIPLYAMFF